MTYRIFQRLAGHPHDTGPERFDTRREALRFIAASYRIGVTTDETVCDPDYRRINLVQAFGPEAVQEHWFAIESDPERDGRHYFEDTGDAYDSTQCLEAIKTGDTLIVLDDDAAESDAVIALAWAWPVAVTKAHGKLHCLDEAPGALERVMADAGWTDTQVRKACFEATWLGAELHPAFAAHIAEQVSA